MERLSLLGLNHVSAPLEVRERLAFDADQTQAAIAMLRQTFDTSEFVLLSTCNRVEIYSTRPEHGPLSTPAAWTRRLTRWLADFHQVPADSFASCLYTRSSEQVMEHLFVVAASLDSLVLGETQIAGQIKAAYEISRQLGAAGRVIHPLFQRAMALGKQVASQTGLCEGRASIASVAVNRAQAAFNTLAGKTVLCIGAGKMCALMLENLAALHPHKLLICNRDPKKAADLAARFKGNAIDLKNLPDHLPAADLVITGTASLTPIVTRTMLEDSMKHRPHRALVVIDICLPRNVEASAGELPNVTLHNLDGLLDTVQATLTHRQKAVGEAHALVAEHMRQFLIAERARRMGPAIDSLYQKYHNAAQETLAKLTEIAPDEKARLQEQLRRKVNKALHEPVRKLRQSDSECPFQDLSLHEVEKLLAA